MMELYKLRRNNFSHRLLILQLNRITDNVMIHKAEYLRERERETERERDREREREREKKRETK